MREISCYIFLCYSKEALYFLNYYSFPVSFSNRKENLIILNILYVELYSLFKGVNTITIPTIFLLLLVAIKLIHLIKLMYPIYMINVQCYHLYLNYLNILNRLKKTLSLYPLKYKVF